MRLSTTSTNNEKNTPDTYWSGDSGHTPVAYCHVYPICTSLLVTTMSKERDKKAESVAKMCTCKIMDFDRDCPWSTPRDRARWKFHLETLERQKAEAERAEGAIMES